MRAFKSYLTVSHECARTVVLSTQQGVGKRSSQAGCDRLLCFLLPLICCGGNSETIGTNSGVGSMKCCAGWKESFKRETAKQSVHAAKLQLSVSYNKHKNAAKLPLEQQLKYFSQLLHPERKEGMCVSAISALSSDYCTFCEGAVLIPARFLNEMWENTEHNIVQHICDAAKSRRWRWKSAPFIFSSLFPGNPSHSNDP